MEDKKQKRPGLAKRIVKWVLLVVLIFILLVALVGLWTWKEQSDYEMTAVPYLESTVPEIATWNPDVVWSFYDDEVKATISQEDSAKVVRFMSILGELETLGHPQFLRVTSSASTKTGVRKVVFYQIPAVFENGDATIDVTLVDRDGKFSISYFNINSMAFVEAATPDYPRE